jgi:hypothetical protein
LSGAQIGEPKYKRNYYSLSLTAERNFNDKFYLNVSYTFARSYGNSEGLVDSNIGQSDTGTSELFDYPELMIGTNGPQTNDHAHTVKAYGAWKITPEWTVGANLLAQTGRPKNCFGDAPIDATIGGYGSSGGSSPYLYCVVDGTGQWTTRGSAGRTPTLWQLDLNAAYAPEWFKGLTLRATIFNVFNKHTPLTVNENQNADLQQFDLSDANKLPSPALCPAQRRIRFLISAEHLLVTFKAAGFQRPFFILAIVRSRVLM